MRQRRPAFCLQTALAGREQLRSIDSDFNARQVWPRLNSSCMDKAGLRAHSKSSLHREGLSNRGPTCPSSAAARGRQPGPRWKGWKRPSLAYFFPQGEAERATFTPGARQPSTTEVGRVEAACTLIIFTRKPPDSLCFCLRTSSARAQLGETAGSCPRNTSIYTGLSGPSSQDMLVSSQVLLQAKEPAIFVV